MWGGVGPLDNALQEVKRAETMFPISHSFQEAVSAMKMSFIRTCITLISNFQGALDSIEKLKNVVVNTTSNLQ